MPKSVSFIYFTHTVHFLTFHSLPKKYASLNKIKQITEHNSYEVTKPIYFGTKVSSSMS